MSLIVDDDHSGATRHDWRARLAQGDVPHLRPLRARRLVVVAPHPDDEVLGAGGLLQRAVGSNVVVEIVIVTDGEASHERSLSPVAREMARIRHAETRVAHGRLGVGASAVTYLHLPDGDVHSRRTQLEVALTNIALPDDLWIAPWASDGHPDHNVTGEVARDVAKNAGAEYLSYLVWTWHWANPLSSDVPWDRCLRLDLTRRERARKRWSSTAYQSQIKAIGPHPDDAPILPRSVLRRWLDVTELFLREAVDE